MLIEATSTALFGRIVQVKLPERERLSVDPELGTETEAHPIGSIQLLTALTLASGEVLGGISEYPRVGAKVYSAHPLLVKWISESSKSPTGGVALNLASLTTSISTPVSITPERLLGRHCAVLGATGGGKSWTVARIIEETARYKCKLILLDPTGEFFTLNELAEHVQLGAGDPQPATCVEVALPHSQLNESDLFALFKPSGQTQVPKLRFAMKSLKLARLQPTLAAASGQMLKANRIRANFEAAQLTHAHALDDPRADFNIHLLSKQLLEECVWPTAKTNNAAWGDYNEQEKSYCVSLVSRIEDMVQNPDFASIFQPGAKDSIFKRIDDFLADDGQRVLRISFKYVPFAHHLREILVNAIGRYLLKLARSSRFKDLPLCVVLDEAHHFIGRSIEDDYNRYPLDQFELIAKEGRKFSLTLCLATQRPRDLQEGILSQVGTLVVHRLTNDRDRDVVERASGDIDKSAAVFLPTLAPGEAVIIGVDFPIPLTLTVTPPVHKPDSRGPDFQSHWAVAAPIATT